MELIVAVYDDWGIGKDGTQQVALSADRKFFRETTRGAMVIVGRRTIEDFPGQKPLPGRINVALTRSNGEIPGFTVCKSPEEAAELAQAALKLARIIRKENPTPETIEIAKANVKEELTDLDLVFDILSIYPDMNLHVQKLKRWYRRTKNVDGPGRNA